MGATALQRGGEHPTKAKAPLANALITDHDATLSQDQLDVAQAQAEAVIQPDGMLCIISAGKRKPR